MQWRCLQVRFWVPQNDILGHPSTKAFLSHVGANGLNEVTHPPTSQYSCSLSLLSHILLGAADISDGLVLRRALVSAHEPQSPQSMLMLLAKHAQVPMLAKLI